MMSSLLLLPVALLAGASVQDVRTREVSDGYSLAIAVSAMVCIAAGWWPLTWYACALGFGVGLVVGVALLKLAKFGGADAKLIAALGFWFGPIVLLVVLIWIAFCGAVLAGIAYARGQSNIPYVPAILAGVVLHAILPDSLIRLTA